ncbi:hypothetical protein CTAYLR_000978 [Chrysophaeum taylorii]|uniref:Uncharacterized protein n=1 Tax=Chrysophaeum taylorii TaxID=2483200 RepID=A0AAD7XLG5_9STRA|nr:hypothetical protein CTAYLR_000978 [Chrysophaeum taylorii]
MLGRRAKWVGFFGGVLVCAGAILIVVTEAVIRANVRESVKIDTRKKFKDALKEPDEDWDLYVWNLTNLDGVLAGEKPRFEEIKYPMVDQERNFDLSFEEDHRDFEFKSWWTYRPKNDEVAAAMNVSNIVQVNPVYLGSVAEFGSEKQLFIELSYFVVQFLDLIVSIGLPPSNYTDPVAAQFGFGGPTRAYGVESVLSFSSFSLVAPEIHFWTGELANESVARQFLDNFSQPSSAAFATASTEERLEYPGVTMENMDAVYEFLYSYLPEKLFMYDYVVGYERLEGTAETDPLGLSSLRYSGSLNSGLFTRRSPWEMLFGYHDVIFDLIPQSMVSRALEYAGLLGLQYDSPESQAAANPPLVYRDLTGKKNYKKVRQYTMWRNTTYVHTRDQFPRKDGTRMTCETWRVQGYESCAIWLEPLDFLSRVKVQVAPFREHSVKKYITLWAPEILRPIKFEYEKNVVVRGIASRKYVVHDDGLRTANCEEDPKCNPKNAVYRMQGPSYVATMATSQGGAPASVSRPVLGQMLEKYRSDLFDGLPDYDEAKHESFFVLEPLTGFFIKGKLRLQYNWDLNKSFLVADVWQPIFDRSDTLYWPFLWFDENDKLARSTARKFKQYVYLPRTLALAFTIIFLVCGAAMIAYALYLHRYKPKTAHACFSELVTASSNKEDSDKSLVPVAPEDALARKLASDQDHHHHHHHHHQGGGVDEEGKSDDHLHV